MYGKHLKYSRQHSAARLQQRNELVNLLAHAEEWKSSVDLESEITLVLSAEPQQAYSKDEATFLVQFKHSPNCNHAIVCAKCLQKGPSGVLICCRTRTCVSCLSQLALKGPKACWKCKANFGTIRLSKVFCHDNNLSEPIRKRNNSLQKLWIDTVKEHFADMLKFKF